MGENDGKGIWALASLVNEVDADAFNFRPKVRKLVDRSFLFLPIAGAMPIGNEFFQIGEVGTRGSVGGFHLIRPSGVRKAVLQIAQHVARNFDPEWTNFVFHSAYWMRFEVGRAGWFRSAALRDLKANNLQHRIRQIIT